MFAALDQPDISAAPSAPRSLDMGAHTTNGQWRTLLACLLANAEEARVPWGAARCPNCLGPQFSNIEMLARAAICQAQDLR